MQKAHKDLLRSLIADLRHTLDGAWNDTDNSPQSAPIRGDLDRELERLGIGPDGAITPLDALPNPSPAEKRAHHSAEAQLTGLSKTERAATRTEIVERAAYTWINRLLALRALEARGLMEETLRANPAYEGVSEAIYLLRYEAPQRTGGADGGWWTVLEDACTAQARRLPGIFDWNDPNAALRPSTPALLHCLQAVGRPELDPVFADPDAISWAYQFYQEEAKKRVYAKLGRGGKVESRAEIAAATQLFTEPYMVKWLLQNSLGRSYHEAYPDSALPAGWDYYIDREKILADDEKIEEQDNKTNPSSHPITQSPSHLFTLDELTFLDPCTGSGHFQREAFDMLFAMYGEQQPEMDARSIADRILSHHLHGIDIDPRAVQLAGVTLVLRAWEAVGSSDYTPPPLNLAATPAHLDPGALERHLQRHPEDRLYRPILEGVFAALAQAPILGSLLKPDEHLDAAIQTFRSERKGGQTGLLAEDDGANRLLAELARHDPAELKKLLLERIARSFARESSASDVAAQLLGREAGEGLHLLALLDRRYAVVATNPPYMGSKNMDTPLRKYVESHYTAGKRDLYAAFILRCLELTRRDGRVAMITQQSWMFLKSFADLRALPEEKLAGARQKGEFTGLLRETALEGLAHLGEHAFEESAAAGAFAAMFTLGKRAPDGAHRMVAFRLIGMRTPIEKEMSLKTIGGHWNQDICSTQQQTQLTSIPDSPIAYWLPSKLIDAFSSSSPVSSRGFMGWGVSSSDNTRFLRWFWECSSGRRWLRHTKGGGYSRWSGSVNHLVDWDCEGVKLKTFILERYPYLGTNYEIKIRPYTFGMWGWSYSSMARGCLGVRILRPDQTTNAKSPTIFVPDQDDILGAILNSRIVSYILRAISSSVNIDEGYVGTIPLPVNPYSSTFTPITQICIYLTDLLRSFKVTEYEYSANTVVRNPVETTGCLAVYLHAIEGYNESQVFANYGLDKADTDKVITETGIPAGWHPLIAGYDALPPLPPDLDLPPLPSEVLDSLAAHERIQPAADELARIAANLQSLYEAGPGAKADDLGLDDLAHQDEEGAESGAYIPIPTETFLEELSVKLQIHPISVYWLLEELRAAGVRCQPEELRLLGDRLTVLVLRLLGHRWPKQIEAGEPVPAWADRDGVIPLTPGTGEATLAERIRSRLRAEEGDLGAQRTEGLLHELTGRSLEEWLRRDFFKRHTSQFKKRPIAWHLASDPRAGGRKKSAQPAFECLLYYHATSGYAPLLERGGGGDILARLRTQYVERLLAPAQRELAQARRYANETAAAQANALIQELEDFARRLRQVEETGFACPELDASLADEALDRWAGDGVFPPASLGELHAQEAAWQVDINDGVRVNVTPVQAAGLLAGDVLAKKDVSKAIADRARWRSDERRWVRAGKLPRCGWLPESVPESPRWTELAPEREKERVRLEEKRAKVLAELGESNGEE